jgi:hypothetical protein
MPQSGQTLGQTQPLFVNNFFTLRSSQSATPYGVGDHYDVNNVQFEPGRHKWVRMPDVNADIPAAVLNMFSLFVKGMPDSEIFYREPLPGAAQIQITNDYFHVAKTATYEGYTLPIIGGLMLKMGVVQVATNTLTTFSFATVTGSDFTTDVLYYIAGRFVSTTVVNTGTAVTTTTFDVTNLNIDKPTWSTFLAIGI